mmetsp:Transcript_150550/g.419546  ORF Transcript_150550/g.419546 Transcript_150550/m.419546 type:complete len:240 (+) Transcript_150550:71-790(+)|eukprot:CAMPEP_0179148628 /NCGR_PEP_ID=MMETSP0796-20121207/71942_1 /TAXON_ID=73915 /ORGANISM="Pyrodinium bahamense, Strain pbaha01" /LENGTH=239 /DNA_ID=CAMNT_0020849373 /DNA_START=66 /DNA_END=785 /DNA_ORIENTATION=+
MPFRDRRVSQIKKSFKKLDRNKDGSLTIAEMGRLLRQGRSDITDRELELLFDRIDKNGNGRIEFGEFVDYIFDMDEQDDPGSRRNTDRRASRENSSYHHRQTWDVVAENENLNWEHIKDTFQAYAGRNHILEGSEFARLCRDCGLFDERLGGHDIDTIFAFVCPKGQRHIAKKQFLEALELIAEKKGCPTTVVRAKIAASRGPILHATKAQAVRFYDDAMPGARAAPARQASPSDSSTE